MQFEYDPERLIDEVRKRPGIWNYNDPIHRIMAGRLELWNEVVAELLQPDVKITKCERRELVLQLQKKWKGMKDAFQKYVQNPQRSKRPYLYYKHLQFLLKNDIRTRSSGRDTEEQSSESDEGTKKRWKKKKLSNITVKNEDDSSEEDNDNDNDPHYIEVGVDEFVPKKTRNSKPRTEEFVFASVDSKSTDCVDTEDSDKLFLLSLLPHFKTIPEESRLSVKMQLMEVLQNANNKSGQYFLGGGGSSF